MSDSPSESNGSGTAAADPNRRADGKFAPGNQLQLKHGGRASLPLVDVEESELYREYEADLGGELTAGQRAVLRRVVEASAVCETAFSYISHSRESIAADRLQRALTHLSSHAAVVFRGTNMLGLERRQKPVDPLQAVEKAVEAANR